MVLGFFKRSKPKDPELRRIVEQGFGDVGVAEESPYPVILVKPYNFVSRYIEENSGLLRGGVYDAAKQLSVDVYTREFSLKGSLEDVRRLVKAVPGALSSVHLVIVDAIGVRAYLLSYYAVITAARLETEQGTTYGIEAVTKLASMNRSVELSFIELREQALRWEPRLSVYVEGLDKEHMVIATSVNNLYKYMLVGSSREELAERIGLVSKLCKQHVEDEERVLAAYKYPELDRHQAEHRAVLRSLSLLETSYDGRETPPLERLVSLVTVIENHIASSDKTYAEWMIKQKIPIADKNLPQKYSTP